MAELGKIILKATIENLPKFIDFVTTHARKHGLSDEKIGDIELAVEEIVTNIFNHAYPDVIENIEIICMNDNGTFRITIIDTGISFNIHQMKDPEFATTLDEVKVGGLGVYLIKKLMGGIKYTRKGNKNILSITP